MDVRTRLISKPGDKQLLTSVRETDVRTAMTRALKEYLEGLSIDWVGGRQSRFASVKQTWSEPEEAAEYPSACVYADSPGTYEASDFTPQDFDLGDSLVVRKVSEFNQPLVVDVVSTDPEERAALVAMLEDAFDPVDWMTGFVLELPHYHNARATFEKVGLSYMDGPVPAHRRVRAARFRVDGSCPQFRFAGLVPKLDLRLDLGESEGGRGGVGPDVEME